jgi:hypothetical protein
MGEISGDKMKIQYNWLAENRVLFAELTGNLQVSDIAEAMKFLLEQLKSDKIECLHLVYNMKGLQPAGRVGELVGVTRELLKHPKLGWIVTYGLDNQVTEFVFKLVIKITNSRVEFVENHSEAMAYLKQIDKTIEKIPN